MPANPQGRASRMRRHHSAAVRNRWHSLGLIMVFIVFGCGDESRTTGTQLQLSPAAKAEQQEIRKAMQEQRAEMKAARLKARGKRGAAKPAAPPRATGKAPS